MYDGALLIGERECLQQFEYMRFSTSFKIPFLVCTDLGNSTETQVFCTSYCTNGEQNKCYPVYQCNNGILILGYQFCNVRFNCPLKNHRRQVKEISRLQMRPISYFLCFTISKFKRRCCALP